MSKDENLPLIQPKVTISSSKGLTEFHNDSSLTNESTINFARLKKTMLTQRMRKSNSIQDLLLTQKSSFPNSPASSFLFNVKEKSNEENEIDDNIHKSIYTIDYLKKFKKIKTNLYKKKFYNNIVIKKIEEEKDKIESKENNENIIYNENNEENENKIDFSKNIWNGEIDLKNAENFDIGGEENDENLEDNITESNLEENNEINKNINSNVNSINSKKTTNKTRNKKKFLYLTDIPNSYNINLNNNLSPIFKKTNFKKIKIEEKSKKQNPFYFSRYASQDNIKSFHKLYRNFKTLCRKHYIDEKSPSFSFIKSCEKEKVICNPLGLFKRRGDESILEMNNQHSGDRYINCLSNGLKYVNHLNTLEMSNNNITHKGMEKLFFNITHNDNFIKNLFKLNLSFNNIGDKGVDNLINFIEEKTCQLENLNIEGNNLGDNNINKLCTCIAHCIWSRINYFNAGKNNITKNSEKGLLFLVEKCTELVVLILRNNQIDNNLGTKLMIKLKNLYSLKVLDISWNLIGDHLVYPFLFEEAVNYNPNKKNLYNNFELDKIKKVMKINFNRNPLLPKIDKNSKGKSSKSKEKNNSENEILEIKSIKVPKRKPSNFAVEFSNYIKSNLCPLIHLNISHNNLPYEDCQLISEESKYNRGILGFHVDGNEMNIDPLGFIHPIKKEEKFKNFYSKSQISYDMDMENFKGIPKLLSSPMNKMRAGNNCWICQCWREIEFVLDLKIKDIKPKYTVVKIHLDFENYEPNDMIYKKKCFRLIRMCPPGKVKFFYTLDGNPVKNCYKEYLYRIKKFELPIKYTFNEKYIEQYNKTKKMILSSMSSKDLQINTNFEKYSFIQEDKRGNDDQLISKTIIVKNYGIRDISPNNEVITQDYQSNLKYSIPRPEPSSSRAENQIPWKFSDSIWCSCNYNYEGVNDEIISKIFDFDFIRGEYDMIFIKESEFISVQEILKEHYKNIINCYINLSSHSGNNLWQITNNILMDWLTDKCNFFDERYTIGNVTKVLESIYFNKIDKKDRMKYKTFPSNKYNLIRHSFLSLLINISVDKYIDVQGVTNSPLEAVKMALENNFIPGVKGYEPQIWRKEKYYNEEIDNYIKAFLPLLDGLFHTFSKQEKEKEKEEKKNEKDKENNEQIDEDRMSIEDFNNFVLTFGDIEYQISENPLIFHISKNLQIDEISNDNFLYLNLIEFCEALFRVIDIICPAPPEEKIEDWPIEKRKEQLLIEKIENIMPQLYKKIDHPNFNVIRDKFKSPLKDQITSLYVIDIKSNTFYNGYEAYYNKENNKS